MLRSAPSAPAELADDLRRRHYSAEIPIPQRVLTSPALVGHLAHEAQRLLPLNEFLARALYEPIAA